MWLSSRSALRRPLRRVQPSTTLVTSAEPARSLSSSTTSTTLTSTPAATHISSDDDNEMRSVATASTALARQLHARAASTHDATFRLPDGRLLGYAEYGSPRGTPIFVLHGFPSSRLEVSPLAAIGTRRNMRLIALDRPGFGLSSPHKDRTIIDFAHDIAAFAQAMDIPRYAVAGFSGGGPYALACAHVLPRRNVGAVGLFASGPPWEGGMAKLMSRPRRVMRWTAVHWPWGLQALLGGVMGTLRWVSATRFVKRKTEEWLEEMDEARKKRDEGKSNEQQKDKRTVSERREVLFRIMDEPFAQGARATAEEARLLSDPDWGFALEDVQYGPAVRIWHGTKDSNAPIEAIRYLADKVPNAVLTEFEGETHYTVGPHIEGALEELVQDMREGGEK